MCSFSLLQKHQFSIINQASHGARKKSKRENFADDNSIVFNGAGMCGESVSEALLNAHRARTANVSISLHMTQHHLRSTKPSCGAQNLRKKFILPSIFVWSAIRTLPFSLQCAKCRGDSRRKINNNTFINQSMHVSELSFLLYLAVLTIFGAFHNRFTISSAIL